MQGIDIFDMKPLDASRRGTMQDPISVRSFGDEQFAGCTGFPADSHVVHWLAMSRDRPVERCPECGNVYKMDYVGPADDGHGHGHDDHRESTCSSFRLETMVWRAQEGEMLMRFKCRRPPCGWRWKTQLRWRAKDDG